jgi:hypothetical protein
MSDSSISVQAPLSRGLLFHFSAWRLQIRVQFTTDDMAFTMHLSYVCYPFAGDGESMRRSWNRLVAV